MKDLLPVLRVLGMLMVMFAGAMLLPFGVSWFTQDGIWRIYPWSIGATVGVGLLLWASLYRHKQDLQPRHGVILVTLVWVVLPLCAMLPLLMGLNRVGVPISATHAYFEAVSGLTTTGAATLPAGGFDVADGTAAGAAGRTGAAVTLLPVLAPPG